MNRKKIIKSLEDLKNKLELQYNSSERYKTNPDWNGFILGYTTGLSEIIDYIRLHRIISIKMLLKYIETKKNKYNDSYTIFGNRYIQCMDDLYNNIIRKK